MHWKKGRGKLGPMAPLLGNWEAEADSPMGKLRCTRAFTSVLGGKYVQLKAHWRFAKGDYEEIALFGVADGVLTFWSYTSDGKRSTGVLNGAADIHADAICFEAHMPAGVARQVYWPDGEGGFHWAVESKNKKGWNRFTEHHYTAEVVVGRCARGPERVAQVLRQPDERIGRQAAEQPWGKGQ